MNIRTHREAMQLAIDLAQAKSPLTRPNPKVGAVIVYRKKILAVGVHAGSGKPHAEVLAIRQASKRHSKMLSQATLYVSLEPCCHTKKSTPPCVPEIIQSGIRTVFIAHRDPNPKVNGKGIRALRRAGIKVNVGLLQNEAEELNPEFIKNQTRRMPYIKLKLAMSFDGKLATDSGESKWITSKESRSIVHRLRQEAGAMGVGKNTIEIDDPRLNVRTRSGSLKKKIVIFGRPKNLKRSCVAKANGPERVLTIKDMGSLRKSLQYLYRKEGITDLLIEGGPTLASAFLDKGLVDEIHLFYGLGFIGGKGRFSLGRAWALRPLSKSIKFRPIEVQKVGPDLYLRGILNVYRTR